MFQVPNADFFLENMHFPDERFRVCESRLVLLVIELLLVLAALGIASAWMFSLPVLRPLVFSVFMITVEKVCFVQV